MVLLHGFIKKTQQTRPADIELALKRALAEQLGDAMHAGKLSKVANGVSKTVEIKLKRQFKPRSQTA